MTNAHTLSTAKRLLVILAAILLLACLPASHQAHAEDFTPGNDLSLLFDPPLRNIQSLATLEGHLVIADGRSLHLVSPAGEQATLALSEVLGPVKPPSYRQPLLVTGGDALAVLDLQSGQLASLFLNQGRLQPGNLVQLDWEDYITRYEHYNEVRPPREFAIAGSTLYALEGAGSTLQSFDLESGRRGDYLKSRAMKLMPYKEGKLLLITLKDLGEDQPRQQMLSVLDPEKDTVREIRPLSGEPGIQVLGDASYDIKENVLLLALNETIYRFEQLGPGIPCASLPINEFYQEALPLSALPGSRLAVASRDSVFVKNASPGAFASQTELRVMITADNPFGINEAINQADGLLVKVEQRSMDALEFAQLLITGEADFDLFWVNLNRVDLDSLMKKGYAADLTGSGILHAAHRQLYPFLQEAVSQEGKVYALPVSAHAEVLLGEKRYAFDDKGQPLIGSIQGFLDYLEAWPERFAADNPDMVAYRGYEMRRGAFSLALRTYINNRMAKGEALDFDTPKLREVFARISGMDWAALGDRADGDDYAAPALFDNEWLIYLRLMDGDGRDSYDYYPFLLAEEEGESAALPYTVSCVFVNAKSAHTAEAIRFLEILSRNLQPDARILLREGDNKPVENPYYEQTLKDYEELLARKRQEMEEAPDLEKAELASWLKQAEGHFEEMKETQRWQISPGQIEAFRKLAQNAFVQRYDSNAQGAKAALDILPQYVDGSISLDQFITEIQNRLRLIQQESQ